MTIFRSRVAEHPPSDNSAPDVARLLKDGRKAKRALRRRMKPKPQRCSERMLGPVIEQPNRSLPTLPRGGDGRALVSLRPSLGPRACTNTSSSMDPSSPGLLATASSLHDQVDGREQGGSMHVGGYQRVQPPSAPSIGGREASTNDDIDQQQPSVRCEHGEDQQHIYPRRPVGGKARARLSYTNAGQRRVKKIRTPTVRDEENGGHFDSAERKESMEPDETDRALSQGEDNALWSHLHTPRQYTIEGEGHAHSQLMEAEGPERSATVVLSSTALLSPRGRARTPTISTAPADGSYFPGGAADRRTASQDASEDWVFSPPPRPHTAPEFSYIGLPEWRSELSASFSTASNNQRDMPQENVIWRHVTSMVSSARQWLFPTVDHAPHGSVPRMGSP